MNRRTACLAALFATMSPQSVFAGDGPVTVFAAASTQSALDDINAAFTKTTTIKVAATYGGSSTLMQQIEKNTSADVFVSADMYWMDYGIERKVINEDTCIYLLGNRLVLIAQKDSKLGNVKMGPVSTWPNSWVMAASRLAMCGRYQSGYMQRKRWKSSGHGTLLPRNLR